MTAPNIMTSSSDIKTLAGNLTGNSLNGDLAISGALSAGALVAVNSLTSPALTLTNSGTALTVKYSAYVETDLADAAGRGTKFRLRPSTTVQTNATAFQVYNSKDTGNCGIGYLQADEFGHVGVGTIKNGTGAIPELYLGSNNVTGVVVSGGDVFLGANGGGAIATTATTGFAYIPKCAGIPTGVPAQISRGLLPLVIDGTNSKMYFYSGGAWHLITSA